MIYKREIRLLCQKYACENNGYEKLDIVPLTNPKELDIL